jgi:antiviral helicase SKI2
VFVAAHTSAGKTVVAEYAIALAAKHMTRTIYTSPIKALSNQKFRDFRNTFGDVGLITGDVSIQPEAACLIVTTEILRSMLYKGADIVRDVEWVIFDECHYVNDEERGVVWEEVIIMLPSHVNMIFLSATAPNTVEFADWVGRTKRKPVHIISTPKRPVPLEHSLYVDGNFYKVMDSGGNFLMLGYQAAVRAENDRASRKTGATKRGGTMRGSATRFVGAAQEKTEYYKLIALMGKQRLLPAVVFSFSRKRCNELAYGLTGLDLTSEREKYDVRSTFERAMSRLRAEDRSLPGILATREILLRGIGIHHSGLLPIVKELVEILFSRGSLKVLFVTETFAMGVNMPARTVVFNAVRKFDGRNHRNLLPGEYIQMSGRAGRRGLDAVGNVVINAVREVPDGSELRSMLMGAPSRLVSQFRLTYNMMLNLLRLDDFRVEDMMKRSFAEFRTQRGAPALRAKLDETQALLQALPPVVCILGDGDPATYHDALSEDRELAERTTLTMLGARGAPVLSIGRFAWVDLSPQGAPPGLPVAAVVCRVDGVSGGGGMGGGAKKAAPMGGLAMLAALSEDAEAAPVDRAALDKRARFLLVATATDGRETTVEKDLPLSAVVDFCEGRIAVSVSGRKGGALPADAREQLLAALARYRDGDGGGDLAPLSGVPGGRMAELQFVEDMHRRHELRVQLATSLCHGCVKRDEHLSVTTKAAALRMQQAELRFELSDSSLALMPEFQQRLRVLRQLKYVDANNVVQIKGRVARELNTVRDELLATETLFMSVLTDLTAAECVAILSSFVYEERMPDDRGMVVLHGALHDAQVKILQLCDMVVFHQASHGMVLSLHEYLDANVNFGLVQVVYHWARGVPFTTICTLSEVPEGSIVRLIVRLEETCREFRNAARIIGDASLYEKMEEASRLIRRDIVFASSLYFH